MNTIVFIFSVIVALSSLLYLEMMRKRVALDGYVRVAARDSAFSPTEFHIYDKSTVTRCDRLIIVYPFDWRVWAVNDQLYILNPEGGIMCGTGSMPAVKVLRDHFLEVCLKIDYDSLIRGYTENAQPSKIVPYEIEGTTFTILSALNLLVKEYVTFAREVSPMRGHLIRVLPENDADDDGNATRMKRQRSVSAQTLERLTARPVVKTHQQLLEQYRWHVRKHEEPVQRRFGAAAAATASVAATET